MRNRISLTLATLALCNGVSTAQAASMSWVFDVPTFAIQDCWGSGSAKATVSDGIGSQAGSLIFSVDLNPLGTNGAFMNKDVASLRVCFAAWYLRRDHFQHQRKRTARVDAAL